MIEYIPFLKAKRGELNAMGQLAPDVKLGICPFFDFPPKSQNYDAASYLRTTHGIVRGLERHWDSTAEFYFDDFDIAQNLIVKNQERYAYVLSALKRFCVIPVVGLGRGPHNDSVLDFKHAGKGLSPVVAFRAVEDDFEDFDLVESDIDEDLAEVFNEFSEIDLILDCRVCGKEINKIAQQAATFARKFCSSYEVRRVIVTGSSIPRSLGDAVKTNNADVVVRRELAIISRVRDLTDITIVPGDYTIVSPFFSDAKFDPRLFPKVTAPRLIYSFDHSHYIARGISLEAGGPAQYFTLTNGLCRREFFRGRGYSKGEEYFDDKRMGIGKNATNGTIVTPSVVAHITYMVRDSTF